MNQERFYLDYNATSPLSQSVTDWLKSGDLLFANPASQHTFGKASRKLINEARSHLYSTFALSDKEFHLFFHSGATEGISSFAHSFEHWARVSGKELLICYSKLDHPAVTGLAGNHYGPHVSFLELKMTQNLAYDHEENLRALLEKKRANADLLILYHHLWVHNETGVVSPLRALCEFKKISDLYIHVDAVQTPGKILDWKILSVGDIFTFSAHKFGALKGVGFSFFSKKISFYPLITGGGQQQGLRSGTENIFGVQSIVLALKDLEQIDVEATAKMRCDLEAFLACALGSEGGVVSIPANMRNSNTIYFYLNSHASDIALALFDLNGLMISAGSACSSGAAKEGPIMLHLGLKAMAKNGLRISLPLHFTADFLGQIKLRFQQVLSKLSATV